MSSERKQDCCEESFSILRKYLSNHEHNIGRNVDCKGHSEELSDGNEKHVIGNWGKAILVIQ